MVAGVPHVRDDDLMPTARTTTDRPRRGAVTVAVAVAVVLALLTGCTGENVDARQQLESRRSSAEAERDNLALLAEVREALSEVAPGLRWRDDAPTVKSGSLCKEPFDAVDGATAQVLESGGAFGPIPDADWPRAWAAVKEVAAKRGYGDEHTLKDAPGAHQVSLYDEDGSELSVGTGVNTVASIYGACYLEG